MAGGHSYSTEYVEGLIKRNGELEKRLLDQEREHRAQLLMVVNDCIDRRDQAVSGDKEQKDALEELTRILDTTKLMLDECLTAEKETLQELTVDFNATKLAVDSHLKVEKEVVPPWEMLPRWHDSPDCTSYVCVMINANHWKFPEYGVKEGERGGHDMALQLSNHASYYIRKEHYRIKASVFIFMDQPLKNIYSSCSELDIKSFIKGFTTHPCEGHSLQWLSARDYSPKTTDEMMKETFMFHAPERGCKFSLVAGTKSFLDFCADVTSRYGNNEYTSYGLWYGEHPE